MPEITAINAPGILISLKGTLSQAINIISDTTVITTDPN
jgi:hypothetical protein